MFILRMCEDHPIVYTSFSGCTILVLAMRHSNIIMQQLLWDTPSIQSMVMCSHVLHEQKMCKILEGYQ